MGFSTPGGFMVQIPANQLSTQSDLVPNSTDGVAGVVSLDQVRNLVQTTPIPATDVVYDDSLLAPPTGATNMQEAVDIALGKDASPIDQTFVDAATGSDTNPGTQLLPLATLQEAIFRLLPRGWSNIRRIVLAPGTYDMASLQNPFGIMLMGANRAGGGGYGQAPALSIVGAFTDELGTLTATATDATGQTITDGSLAMAADEYFGAFLSITSGPSTGQRRMIAGNTATAFTLNQAFAGGGSVVGATFVVERPAVTILFKNLMWTDCGGLIMKGLKFVPKTPGTGNALGFNFFTGVFGEGLEVQLGANDQLQSFAYSRMRAGSSPGFFPPAYEIMSSLRGPAGMFVRGIDGGGAPGLLNIQGRSGYDSSYLCLKQMRVTANTLANCGLINPNAIETSFVISNQGQLFANGTNPNPSRWRSSALPLADTVNVSGQSLVTLNKIDISDSLGNAIKAKHGAQLNLGLVAGTGNAGYGVVVQQSSQGVIDSLDLGGAVPPPAGSGLTSVVGAAGETSVGGTPTTYVAIRALAPAAAIVGVDALQQDSL